MSHPHVVTLKVNPYLPLECRFWLTDDGWNGTVDALGISVQAGGFEQAKMDLELAMGRPLEALLRERMAMKKQVA